MNRPAIALALAGAAGALGHALALLDALTDRAYAEVTGQSADVREIADGHVRNELHRLVAKTAVMSAGIVWAVAGRRPSPRAVLAMEILVIGAVTVMDVTTWLERRSRKRLLGRHS